MGRNMIFRDKSDAIDWFIASHFCIQCSHGKVFQKFTYTCVEEALMMTPVGEVSEVEPPPELSTFNGSVIDPAGIAPPAKDT